MFPVVLLALSLVPAATPPKTLTLNVGELKREALVFTPAKSDRPAPLVFVFHGHGGGVQQVSKGFRLHELWPEAVVVYPQGVPTPGKLTDPEGKKNGWQAKAGDHHDRDLKFVDELLKQLRKDYLIDDKRIYSTGHSNGGGFTYLLWANRGDVFAAVAPSAAVAGYAKDLKPKPCLHIAGEADELVKFAWQSRMMEAVKKLNHCESTGKDWAKSGDWKGTAYESKSGTPFVSLIGPADHKFPSADAPKLIVKFFQEHTKK